MTRPLKVVHNIASLIMGGEQRYVIRLANRLPRDRYDQTLVTTYGDALRHEIAPDVKVVELVGHKVSARRPADWLASAAFAKDFGAVVRKEKADLVTTHCPGVIPLLSMATAKALRRPVIHTIQRPYGNRSPTEDAIIRTPGLREVAYGLVDRFVALGSYYAKDQATNWRIPERKITMNYIGIDLSEYAPSPEAGADARRELGFAADAPVLGVVARHSPEKGIDRAIRVLAAIRKRLPNARLLLVGDGPTRAANEELVRSLGLQDAALFVGARTDSARLMNACDVVMQCTYNPLNGISSIETMAVGRPVVTLVDRPEEEEMAADTCEEGRNGLFYRTTRHDESADRLAALLSDRSKLSAYGTESRKMALERFDIDAHVARVDELYTEVASQARSAQA